jgi:PPM family protein phosphatase
MTETAVTTYFEPVHYGRLGFEWAFRTDTGLCREQNEDAFIIEPEIGLFLLSDGMGGHRGGEIASAFVSETLSVRIETGLYQLRSMKSQAVRSFLTKAITCHNREVHVEGISESGIKGMGATLVLCLIQNGRAYVANLGDSRFYRLRDGKLTRLTKDHTVVSELIEQGMDSADPAFVYEYSGVITQYMGMEEPADPHVRSFKLQSGDRLLLCSDGLTDMLDDQVIQDILTSRNDLDEAVETLVREANHAGGHDNITTLLIEWHAIV